MTSVLRAPQFLVVARVKTMQQHHKMLLSIDIICERIDGFVLDEEAQHCSMIILLPAAAEGTRGSDGRT